MLMKLLFNDYALYSRLSIYSQVTFSPLAMHLRSSPCFHNSCSVNNIKSQSFNNIVRTQTMYWKGPVLSCGFS